MRNFLRLHMPSDPSFGFMIDFHCFSFSLVGYFSWDAYFSCLLRALYISKFFLTDFQKENISETFIFLD